MTNVASSETSLPRWSVADLHESLDARTFRDAQERLGADVSRLLASYDEYGIRAITPRDPTNEDGEAADHVLRRHNQVMDALDDLGAYVYSFVATNTRDQQAQAIQGSIDDLEAKIRPLMARLADWVTALDVDALARLSTEVAEHRGPLHRLAARTAHQMSEAEEGLYSELSTTASGAWARLHSDLTSQLSAPLAGESVPINAVRGMASAVDEATRRSGYEAEMEAWPTIATPIAAAMNAIKGEANAINRRRNWPSPLDASLFANSVSRPTYEALSAAVDAALPDFQRWMRIKAEMHEPRDGGGLAWWNLIAPLPGVDSELSWEQGITIVDQAFASYGGGLSGLVDRALDESWIDAPPADGKVGGAFCMPFVGDRSLVLLNWSGSVEAAQTTAHELGHAYHNVTLAGRTALQRRLPMALAETASIFCETLTVDHGLEALDGLDRLALLDTDLGGANQVVVDIRSRVLFETEVFARRQSRTLSTDELCGLMGQAQQDAYGEGIDQSTAHPWMWLLKGHYYGSHFYNWPYTFGHLFGLGLFARYQDDPDRFRLTYDDLLSRAGMDTAENLGAVFGLDISDIEFWTASLDVIRGRIGDYEALAADLGMITR
jgi:pepF/M3 family oligoendopeptidase